MNVPSLNKKDVQKMKDSFKEQLERYKKPKSGNHAGIVTVGFLVAVTVLVVCLLKQKPHSSDSELVEEAE